MSDPILLDFFFWLYFVKVVAVFTMLTCAYGIIMLLSGRL